jgi:hypothetical protein
VWQPIRISPLHVPVGDVGGDDGEDGGGEVDEDGGGGRLLTGGLLGEGKPVVMLNVGRGVRLVGGAVWLGVGDVVGCGPRIVPSGLIIGYLAIGSFGLPSR